METPKLKKKNVLPRLKTHLLQGKSITHIEALRMFGTNRLAEYIRILRHEHKMKIECVYVNDDNGNVYGLYRLVQKPKVSKITTREYSRVGAG